MSSANLAVIEHRNQRVLTTTQLADAYEVEPRNISDNFANNRKRYQEGKHYFYLEGEALRAFKCETENFGFAPNLNRLNLWTEKGALLHAKSLNTDKAWEVYDILVETYFRSREMLRVPKSLPEALRMAADLAEQIEKQAPLVAFAETSAKSKDSILIRELAKICCKAGVETGERRLYQKLREWGLIIPGRTEPYQEYVDRGYFELHQGTRETTTGVKLYSVTRVLPKGQQYIMHRLRKESAQQKKLAQQA